MFDLNKVINIKVFKLNSKKNFKYIIIITINVYKMRIHNSNIKLII